MLVLDTCAFIWLALQPAKISKRASKAIKEHELTMASMTFLELGFLQRKGRLGLPCGLSEFTDMVLQAHDISVIDLSSSIVEQAMSLPDMVNADPADRVISATAIHLDARLVTADKNLRNAGAIPTLW